MAANGCKKKVIRIYLGISWNASPVDSFTIRDSQGCQGKRTGACCVCASHTFSAKSTRLDSLDYFTTVATRHLCTDLHWESLSSVHQRSSHHLGATGPRSNAGIFALPTTGAHLMFGKDKVSVVLTLGIGALPVLWIRSTSAWLG